MSCLMDCAKIYQEGYEKTRKAILQQTTLEDLSYMNPESIILMKNVANFVDVYNSMLIEQIAALDRIEKGLKEINDRLDKLEK